MLVSDFGFSRDYNQVDGAYLHDPSAALAAIAPDLFGWKEAPVRVVRDGFARGHSLMVKPYYVQGTANCNINAQNDSIENA